MLEQDRQDADRELVEQIQQAPEGDLRAFEALVERHKERVVANCRYLSRSADDAEDLAQEVFVKVFFGLARFQGRSAFRTWLQRVKVNHVLNHLRKREGKRFVEIEDAQAEDPESMSVPATAERAAEALDERDGGRIPPDDVDPGAPIAALAELRVEPSMTFLTRVRHRVERRSLGSQLLSLTWYAPAVVVLEFVTLIFGALGAQRPCDDDS